jgi:hypothetical protein
LGIAIDIFQSNRIRLLDDTFRLFFSLPIGKLLQQFLPFLLDLPGKMPTAEALALSAARFWLLSDCSVVRRDEPSCTISMNSSPRMEIAMGS